MLATFDLAGHVIGIIVNTDLTDELLDEVILEIKARLEQYEQVNVYLELEKGHEISFKASNDYYLNEQGVVLLTRQKIHPMYPNITIEFFYK